MFKQRPLFGKEGPKVLQKWIKFENESPEAFEKRCLFMMFFQKCVLTAVWNSLSDLAQSRLLCASQRTAAVSLIKSGTTLSSEETQK